MMRARCLLFRQILAQVITSEPAIRGAAQEIEGRVVRRDGGDDGIIRRDQGVYASQFVVQLPEPLVVVVVWWFVALVLTFGRKAL